ncbi:MAG: hypothetical protein ACOYM7_05550 [Paludibacter sp.]
MREINVFEIPIGELAKKAIEKMNTGTTVFDTDNIVPMAMPEAPGLRGFVPWGDGNLRPNEVLELIRKDEVMSPNMFFNILSSYSNGLTYTKKDKTEITDQEIIDFFKFNRPTKYLFEQQTDMKHFFWTVSVLILSLDGTKIVKLRHKDVMYCRLETCNPATGALEHVFYGNWEKGAPLAAVREDLELLDVDDPLGDLMVRMGKLPGENGELQKPTKTRKFAMLNRIPIPGNKYYPFPYYWSLFNSGWYDVKQMIPAGKKAKFANGLVMKYQVEINDKYWDVVFSRENITDPVKQNERMTLEKENIKSFLTGIVNAGKVWFSGFYVDPHGKEQSMVRITVINNEKEGGDWIEDTEEGASMACYATGNNPGMIGVTPGKSAGQMNGSNIRELFTMKQGLEKAPKDILLEPYFVIKHYNEWDIEFDIPFMMLTTLDKKTDAQASDAQANPTNDNPPVKKK